MSSSFCSSGEGAGSVVVCAPFVSVGVGTSNMFMKFPPPLGGLSKMLGGLIGCGLSGKLLLYTSCAPPTMPIRSLIALRISSLESSFVSIVSFISFQYVQRKCVYIVFAGGRSSP